MAIGEALGDTVAFDARLVRRLWGYVRPHQRWIWISLALLLATSACQLLGPWMVTRVIDENLTPPTNNCIQVNECSGTQLICAGAAGWMCDYANASGDVSHDGMGNLVPESDCDEKDNDCDGVADCDDTNGGAEDCSSEPTCQSGCVNPGGAPAGSSCSGDGDCCSNKCRGSSGSMTCK